MTMDGEARIQTLSVYTFLGEVGKLACQVQRVNTPAVILCILRTVIKS